MQDIPNFVSIIKFLDELNVSQDDNTYKLIHKSVNNKVIIVTQKTNDTNYNIQYISFPQFYHRVHHYNSTCTNFIVSNVHALYIEIYSIPSLTPHSDMRNQLKTPTGSSYCELILQFVSKNLPSADLSKWLWDIAKEMFQVQASKSTNNCSEIDNVFDGPNKVIANNGLPKWPLEDHINNIFMRDHYC